MTAFHDRKLLFELFKLCIKLNAIWLIVIAIIRIYNSNVYTTHLRKHYFPIPFINCSHTHPFSKHFTNVSHSIINLNVNVRIRLEDTSSLEASRSPIHQKSETATPPPKSPPAAPIAPSTPEWPAQSDEDIDRLVAMHRNRNSLSSLGVSIFHEKKAIQYSANLLKQTVQSSNLDTVRFIREISLPNTSSFT